MTTLTRRSLVLGALAALAGGLSGCGAPTYANRTDDLNKQFELGERSRSLAQARGVRVDASDCTDMWVTSGANHHHEHSKSKDWSTTGDDKGDSGITYNQTRKQYFINGCLDQTRGSSPTPAPSMSRSS